MRRQGIDGALFDGSNWAHLNLHAPLAQLFAKTRRDGARMLSSGIVITSLGWVRIDHTAGQIIAVLGSLICLYWWSCYRRLER